jgi:catalase
MVGILTLIDKGLANKVAAGLGIVAKAPTGNINQSFGADENPKDRQPLKNVKPPVERSEALSMKNTAKNSIATRRIAFLAADGVDDAALNSMKKTLEGKGAMVKIIAPRLGFLKSSTGAAIKIDESFLTAASVVYDAVFVPGGKKSVAALVGEADAQHFVSEAYKHCKAIAASAEGVELLQAAFIDLAGSDEGIVVEESGSFGKAFVNAIAQHRFWEREKARKVPA